MTLLTTPLQQQTITATDEDWTKTVSFAQFDPSLGTLVDVRFVILGTVTTSASIENLSPAAASVQIGLPGSIFSTEAFLLGGIDLGPTTTVNLGGYDGSTNFSGTSGTLVSISDTESVSAVISAASFAGSVIGTGTYDVTTTSFASSSVAGDANLRTLLRTNAGAVLSLQYDYVDAGGTNAGGGDVLGVFAVSYITSANVLQFFDNATTTAAQVVTLSNETSGWSGNATVDQFDPSLGTLLAVEINVGNAMTGAFSAENLGTSAGFASVTSVANLTVLTPGITTSVSSYATAKDTIPFTSYDGTTDFAGTSGKLDLLATKQFDQGIGVVDLTDAAALAAFTGTGTFTLPVSSVGTSTVNGSSSNLLSEITQQTDGTVSVRYVYQADVACFAEGTRIATPDGEVTVECLAVGQLVSLVSGAAAPVVWIGHREVDCRRHPTPEAVWPVRVPANTFADGVPSRDLYLSPDHAVFVDDVLIPVRCLIGAGGITQIRMHHIQYFHIELARHDILLVETFPVESFLDAGVRRCFDNGGATVALHPNFAPLFWEAAACAPLLQAGTVVAGVRRRLTARAWELSTAA